MQAGVDVGGTFTDLALWDGAELLTGKVPTVPSDQSVGVLGVLRAAGAARAMLLHGTTVATNALLERSGARTALVTDSGFEDLIEIARQDRPSLYDVEATRPEALVPPPLRFGLDGRAAADGGIDLDDASVSRLVRRIAEAEPEAIAISLLFSFVASGRERAVADAIATALPRAAMTWSSRAAPEFREYERLSTTVINAYLIPIVSRYLSNLERAAVDAGVVGSPAVMRSSGGLMRLEAAALLPAAIVLSGPAGGVVAAGALGSALGYRSLVSFDMGGTSTDVCRITDGRPEVLFERAIGGLPNRMPSVAVHTVGAGGGSVAWIDPGGALRVGPQSAGAVPGPVAYGRGGVDPTVTDANLVTGRLGSAVELAGSLVLDAGAARSAIEVLGDRLGLDMVSTALGVIEVVESHMERALRVVSVEEGTDPRDAMLIAFGGAGAMHATALARRLEMAGVIVPPHAGVFSALGLLLAPPRADSVTGVLLEPGDDIDSKTHEVLAAVSADLEATGASPEAVESTADVRYLGQSHETSVSYEPGDGWEVLTERFHAAHLERNGFARRGDPIEVVAVRAAATGRPALTIDQLPPQSPVGEAWRGEREVLTGSGAVTAAVWWRPGLEIGSELVGPAVVEEPEATTYLAEGEWAVVHGSGALEVSWA